MDAHSCRLSPTPASVGLLRADLAEMWPVEHPESERLKTPAPVFQESYLDLEHIQTPTVFSPKIKKQDPLVDMIMGVITPTPKLPIRSKPLPDGHDDPSSHDEAEEILPETHISPTASSRKTKSLEVRPKSRLEEQNSESKLVGSEYVRAKASSPARATRRQAAPKFKQKGTLKINKRQPAKGTKQDQTSPEYDRLLSGHAVTKTRTKKRGNDIFDLSDITESDGSERPRKRQAQEQTNQEHSTTDKVSVRDRDGNTIATNRPRRRPKVLKDPMVLETLNQPEIKPTTNQVEPSNPKSKTDVGHRSPKMKLKAEAEWVSKKSSGVVSDFLTDLPPFALQSSEADQRRSTSAFMNQFEPLLPKQKLASSPPILHTQVHKENITTDTGENGDHGNECSTSPLLVDQDPAHTDSKCPAVACLGNQPTHRAAAGSSAEKPDIKAAVLPSIHLDNSSNTIRRSSERLSKDPVAIKNDAVRSNAQPQDTSPLPNLKDPSAIDALAPEEMWRRAIDDDSPPLVLQRLTTVSTLYKVANFEFTYTKSIVTKLLHRSLKPKEEIVRDIAAEYEQNALRMIDNMSSRHWDEKEDMYNLLQQASRKALSIVVDAAFDIRTFTNRLQEVDLSQTTSILSKSGLADKLGVATRSFYQKVKHHTETGSIHDLMPDDFNPVSDSESQSEVLDALATTYRLRLFDAMQHSDNQDPDSAQSMVKEVNDFIEKCLAGDIKKAARPEAKQKPKPATPLTIDEELEAALNSAMVKKHHEADKLSAVGSS